MMEPDHVDETPSQDFALVAAVGDICDGPRGLDDHGQELLAERGQAERTNQNCWLAKQFEFGVRTPRVIRVAQNPGDVRKSAIERAILVAHAGATAVY